MIHFLCLLATNWMCGEFSVDLLCLLFIVIFSQQHLIEEIYSHFPTSVGLCAGIDLSFYWLFVAQLLHNSKTLVYLSDEILIHNQHHSQNAKEVKVTLIMAQSNITLKDLTIRQISLILLRVNLNGDCTVSIRQH